MHMFKKLLRPRLLIPIVVIGALVVALFGFADLHKVLQLVRGFQLRYLVFFLLLMFAYTAVRGFQWIVFLRALEVRSSLRAEVFSFLGGEVTKYMPIGNYFQNYLLKEASGTRFARTSAASTIIVLIEVAVSLGALIILGITSWGWLRPVIVIGLAVFGFVVWSLSKLHASIPLPDWLTGRGWYRAAAKALDDFREGAVDLLVPGVLVKVVPLGVLYCLCAAAAMYMVVLGLGISHLSFWQALAAYFFSLAFTLIVPVPIDIGVFEASGIGALVAQGVGRNEAVSIALVNRALGLGVSFVLALLIALILHDELRAALGHRAAQKKEAARQRQTPAAGQDSAGTCSARVSRRRTLRAKEE